MVESALAYPISDVDVTEYVPGHVFFGTLKGNETAFDVPFGIVKGGVVNITDLELEQEMGLRGPARSNSTLTV